MTSSGSIKSFAKRTFQPVFSRIPAIAAVVLNSAQPLSGYLWKSRRRSVIFSFIFCGIVIIFLSRELLFPFFFFETDQHPVWQDGERAFDEHPVGGEQPYLLCFGECW